jgi:BMFP domain-containing protein YqiC
MVATQEATTFTGANKLEVLAGDLIRRMRVRARNAPETFGEEVEASAKNLATALEQHAFEIEKPLSDQARETLEHAAKRVKELEDQLSSAYKHSALVERTYARREGEMDAKVAASIYEGNLQAEARFKRAAKACDGKPEDPAVFVERTCELYGMPPRGKGLAMPAGDTPS